MSTSEEYMKKKYKELIDLMWHNFDYYKTFTINPEMADHYGVLTEEIYNWLIQYDDLEHNYGINRTDIGKYIFVHPCSFADLEKWATNNEKEEIWLSIDSVDISSERTIDELLKEHASHDYSISYSEYDWNDGIRDIYHREVLKELNRNIK